MAIFGTPPTSLIIDPGAIEDQLDGDVFALQFARHQAFHRQDFLERRFVVLAQREGVVAAEGEEAEGARAPTASWIAFARTLQGSSLDTSSRTTASAPR